MRPHRLDNFVGQAHLVGPGAPVRRLVEGGTLRSLIFWGPPGVGKTTLAGILAESVQLPFFTLSAIDSGVREVRAVIEKAREAGGAVLFVDEIHRFNKAQQDSLLGAVERGVITLIGATTENPSFEVISALLSRCQVYVLKALGEQELKSVAQQALRRDAVLCASGVRVGEWEALLHFGGGDARRLLNVLELAASAVDEAQPEITNATVERAVQHKAAVYDKSGEMHYDVISAFIKSLRGSDPNAAVYYLARMIAGGEDPKFIARRMVILASEDIGNANPNALLLATSTAQAVQLIGWPESRIILSQCATYLATSPKSNAAYVAINDAQSLVEKTGDLPVPLSLRNAKTSLMKGMGYGKGYGYSHDGEESFIAQEFLPEAVSGTRLYNPGNNAAEARMRTFLRERWGDKYGY